MKKIINGKMYNDETAEEICTQSDGLMYNDFTHIHKILFKKKTGEFFLEIYGGPMTQYNGETSIKPITIETAKKFTEEHGSAEKYIELFGEVEE